MNGMAFIRRGSLPSTLMKLYLRCAEFNLRYVDVGLAFFFSFDMGIQDIEEAVTGKESQRRQDQTVSSPHSIQSLSKCICLICQSHIRTDASTERADGIGEVGCHNN